MQFLFKINSRGANQEEVQWQWLPLGKGGERERVCARARTAETWQTVRDHAGHSVYLYGLLPLPEQ